MRPLRDHIEIAILDLNEVLNRTDGEIHRDIAVIRRKLAVTLEADRETGMRRIAVAHYAPLSAEEIAP